MEAFMRRKLALSLLLAAGTALSVPLAARAQAQQFTDLASVAGSGNFEFRGRQTMWKFTRDGRVSADDSRTPALVLGGSSEQFGMKRSGTWRRVGDQLCITWGGSGAQAEECYTVAPGKGRMVKLIGPRIIEGTLDASGPDEGLAESPSRVAPGVTYPPSYRYQRVPGPR
jgi:hypothetical protein